MNSPRNTHFFIGLQFFFLAGYLLHTFRGMSWWAALVGSLAALWCASLGATAVGYSMWPQRYPRLSVTDKPGWKLRLRHVERVAEELKGLGFVEIGTKIERTLYAGGGSREFWHPQHRTFASLIAPGFAPKVTFMTKGECGTLLYSGGAVQSRQRTVVSRLLVGSSLSARLEDHTRAIRGEELKPAQAPAERGDYREDVAPTKEALAEWRLKLAREWYVAIFAKDAVWERWRAEHAPRSVRVGDVREAPLEAEVAEVETSASAMEKGQEL